MSKVLSFGKRTKEQETVVEGEFVIPKLAYTPPTPKEDVMRQLENERLRKKYGILTHASDGEIL
jgi:hypothetical protein